jgi:glycosyltransferase involved in cell wall biosynthesis
MHKLAPREGPRLPHVFWVYGESPRSLDASTWLDTTRELRDVGWRATLVVDGPSELRDVQGVAVTAIPKPQVYLVRQILFHLALWREIVHRWRDIDILLFHRMSALWLLPLRLVRMLQGRTRPLLVMDTRTVFMADATRQRPRDRLRRAFQEAMEHAANRWADGRLAITERMASAVGIPRARLWGVWPSGVSLRWFSPFRGQRRWPGPHQPIHVIYIGTLAYERRLMALARAVEMANAEGLHVVATFVGAGDEKEHLKAFARGTAGRVRVLDAVPHEKVPRLLVGAHVGALPFPDEAKFRVSSPIKLFEYMAAEMPILATRIACHTDVLEGARFVFWAEDAGEEALLMALRRIAMAREALPRLGQEAGRAAQAHTWTASAAKLKQGLEYGMYGHPEKDLIGDVSRSG